MTVWPKDRRYLVVFFRFSYNWRPSSRAIFFLWLIWWASTNGRDDNNRGIGRWYLSSGRNRPRNRVWIFITYPYWVCVLSDTRDCDWENSSNRTWECMDRASWDVTRPPDIVGRTVRWAWVDPCSRYIEHWGRIQELFDISFRDLLWGRSCAFRAIYER